MKQKLEQDGLAIMQKEMARLTDISDKRSLLPDELDSLATIMKILFASERMEYLANKANKDKPTAPASKAELEKLIERMGYVKKPESK